MRQARKTGSSGGDAADRRRRGGLALLFLAACAACAAPPGSPAPAALPLFPADGAPVGFLVRHWADVKDAPARETRWEVRDGVLLGGEPRGSWLLSEREYGDFRVEFEFRLGARGNSGLALRTPLAGDPAFDAIEIQMADLRYNPEAKPSELTGGIYRALAPSVQAYRPEQWNRLMVTAIGPRLQVCLNGELIQDVDLDHATADVLRHDGRPAVPLAQRPRRGHLGFQELSRDGSRVEIRGATVTPLDAPR
ncbi:MAG: DUF1080 domain-containing protein [Planctomycetes bacterium]|nr:DUF1080 domain-containing protein [Planctomycetota bacterium]